MRGVGYYSYFINIKKMFLLSVPIEQPYYAGAQEHVYLLLIFKKKNFTICSYRMMMDLNAVECAVNKIM